MKKFSVGAVIASIIVVVFIVATILVLVLLPTPRKWLLGQLGSMWTEMATWVKSLFARKETKKSGTREHLRKADREEFNLAILGKLPEMNVEVGTSHVDGKGTLHIEV